MNRIRMYGAAWCGDCRRAKSFLNDHTIDYDFIDIDVDTESVEKVEKINNGKRIIPTFEILDSPYTNPDNRKLASILGINDAGRVILYGADWCPDCRRAKSFLTENDINFQYISIDAHSWAVDEVEKVNAGKRIIPTVVINGEPYSNPSNSQLLSLLNITVSTTEKVYDCLIVGAGAAGLTTAIYLQRDKYSTVILERKNIGGNAFLTEKIENYPGFTEISGPDLMDRMSEQAQFFGAEIKEGTAVETISRGDSYFNVGTDSGTFRARALVLAVGSFYRRLSIPGESDLIGAGIHFCATCDAPFYKGKRVIVIGGGNSALEEGIFLSETVSHVTIVHRSPAFKASETYIEKIAERDNIDTVMNKTSVEFLANDAGQFKALRVKDNDTGSEELLEADGVFIFIGLVPNTGFLDGFVSLTEHGFIDTECGTVKTSQAGIFAAGDCRVGAVAQVAAATGEGVIASFGVKEYLRSLNS